MNLAKDFLNELKQEAAVTRRFLESVPFEKRNFKPHKKSESLGRLAIHVAEIIAWWKSCLQDDELDFIDFEPKEINSTKELLSYFDQLLKESIQAFEEVEEKEFEKNWSMKHGEEVLFTLNKKEVMRKFCTNHLVHHRAQLGVYLRMLDVAVPAVYGPSADDFNITLVESFA
ncbi:MAG: DinB family protein [Saprospiraceae bacterium]